MKLITSISLFFVISLLVACGSGSVSKTELTKACNEAVNWNEESCECMAGKAKEDLSAKGQQLLYASLTEDSEAAQELARNMTLEEATQAGMFMVNAGLSCAVPEGD